MNALLQRVDVFIETFEYKKALTDFSKVIELSSKLLNTIIAEQIVIKRWGNMKKH